LGASAALPLEIAVAAAAADDDAFDVADCLNDECVLIVYEENVFLSYHSTSTISAANCERNKTRYFDLCFSNHSYASFIAPPPSCRSKQENKQSSSNNNLLFHMRLYRFKLFVRSTASRISATIFRIPAAFCMYYPRASNGEPSGERSDTQTMRKLQTIR
jgi:hypothetical protein